MPGLNWLAFIGLPGGVEWLVIAIIGLLSLGIPVVLVVLLVLLLRTKPWSRETRCRRCGHTLHGLAEPRCPDCGEAI